MKHTFYIQPLWKNKKKSSMQTDYVEIRFVSFIQRGTLVQYCFKASTKQVIYKLHFLLMFVTTMETQSSFNTVLTSQQSYSYYWEVETVKLQRQKLHMNLIFVYCSLIYSFQWRVLLEQIISKWMPIQHLINVSNLQYSAFCQQSARI
jgi:hypothetical protein